MSLLVLKSTFILALQLFMFQMYSITIYILHKITF